MPTWLGIGSWPYRKKILIGLISAYACAVAIALLTGIHYLYSRATPPESVWELMRGDNWKSFLGYAITRLPWGEVLAVSVFLLPLAVFAVFPKWWIWVIATFSLCCWLWSIDALDAGRALGEAIGALLGD